MNEPAWAPPAPGTRWLLRLPNWIGDAILVLPALRALPREGQVRLGVAHPRVIDLYRATGLLDEVWPAEGWRAPAVLARRLRSWKPDRAVVFTEALSGALLARAAGSPRRLSPARPSTRPRLTRAAERPGRGQPLWRHYADLAQRAGGTPVATPDFRIDPGPDAAARVRDLLPWAAEEGAVALAPGAAYGPSKQWPLESFAHLCRELRARGAAVVTVGSGREREAGAALAAAGALDLTGATGILEAVALLARCRVLVTNDSGALHLARAAGTPVVSLFGSTSPLWTGPEPEAGETLWLGLPCSPCFRRRCPLSGDDHRRCLREIGVDTVLASLDRATRHAS